MGISYPASVDAFPVPTLPETTSLSSAGTSTRAHTDHHRDLGSGLSAVMANAALKAHDHTGDGTTAHGVKLRQANTHESPDTDTVSAIHHTLGKGQYQAAAGNHGHDYTSGEITNKPLEICTSVQRPDPFPGKMILERDTNRFRMWAQFPGQRQAVQGQYYVDAFERVSTTSMGTGWEQTYTISSGAGVMATPNGHSVAWTEAGAAANRCIARRTDTATSQTQTFDQVITFNTNDHVADWDNANADNPNTNDAYFRMSADGQHYVRAALTWWKGSSGAIMLTYTNTGPVGEQLIGQLPAQSNTPNILWQFRLVGNKFEVYMGVEYIGSIQDNQNVTEMAYKGWGIGMQAGDGGASQSLPNELSEVGIADATYFTSSAIWQLLPVADVPKVGLAAGRAQLINPTGSVIEWDVVVEDNFGFYHVSDPTSLIISEAGVYHVHASIIWGTELYGDHAATVLLVNGQVTPHMHWEFLRGFNYTPGFSQTVDTTAYVRFAQGDRLSVAASHNGGAPQYTGYKKNNTITQLSRLFVTYHSA